MEQLLERILATVEKPSRYVGGEWNSISKKWDQAEVKMAFAFPDVYEVGMSHLGMQILYKVVNDRPDALMERVFAPWVDMEEKMRAAGLPLFSLESRRSLAEFDVVGFTLQYEMSFTNILNMLDMAGIPMRSSDRKGDNPLVIAGGPCGFNPEPLAPFIDAFVLGEGEEVINAVLDVYLAQKQQQCSRRDTLSALAGVEGIYVPVFYQFEYKQDGTVKEFKSDSLVPTVVKKRVVADVNDVPFPTRPIVPHTDVVHDRMMLEVMRGCTRGCRFCQAGTIYRPVREKDPENLLAQAEELVRSTGWDEISLTSLSSSDYSGISEVISGLVDRHSSERINVALPSLRADAFSVELAKEVQRVRRSSLTFAPEAGTQRLRDVINKGVTEENLMEAVTSAFKAGWSSVKLYFMIGLPSETESDLEGIVSLARRVLEAGRNISRSKGRLRVTVSASSFVPKSHTPFQWEPQDSLIELQEKQRFLKQRIKGKGLTFNWHEGQVSMLEADLARGNRDLAPVLERAWALGCRFDGWSECFDFSKWEKAFECFGIKPGDYALRRYSHEDVLPWDHLDAGVSKKYLALEHKRALDGVPTVDCRGGKCPGCGICPSLEINTQLVGGKSVEPVQDLL
ncbi:MAG: TIGR03960 family B12-binding radical SAM protein [Firmicutes bacterium]|nr:TIGR03960 family B12-binding radical SAM protein [Bacillota bacterium]